MNGAYVFVIIYRYFVSRQTKEEYSYVCDIFYVCVVLLSVHGQRAIYIYIRRSRLCSRRNETSREGRYSVW